MKLKTAINIIQSSYTILFFAAVVSIVGFFKSHAIVRLLIIGLWPLIIFFAFRLKLNFINNYLKRCKYPYEFLYVLRDLGCTDDLTIDWLEVYQSGREDSKLFTRQFLEDNKLATEFARKSLVVPIILIILAIIMLAVAYTSQTHSSKEQSLWLTIIIFAVVFTIYFLWKRKKQQTCSGPTLAFNEMGVSVEGTLYSWNTILNWEHKSAVDGNGTMLITYADFTNKKQEFHVNLNVINIDRIELMILLTHFKASYTV